MNVRKTQMIECPNCKCNFKIEHLPEFYCLPLDKEEVAKLNAIKDNDRKYGIETIFEM